MTADPENNFDVQTYIKQEAKLTNVNQLAQQLEDAEQFLANLPNLSYEVSKTLHGWVGKKVTRRLMLTTKGIANLRSNGEVSSLYEYDRVIKVTLSNVNTLVIEYKAAKHPYVYSSAIAMEIVQEIQIRLQLYNATRKKRMTLRLAAPYLSVLQGIRQGDKRSSILLSKEESNNFQKNILSSRTSRNTIALVRAKALADQEALKLTSLINTILLDSKTYEEAKAVKNFLDNFDALEKNPNSCMEMTRTFMNNLKERILSARYQLLSAVVPATSSGRNESQNDMIGRETESCIEKYLLLRLHDRIQEMARKIYKKDDQVIDHKIDYLSKKSQAYFGVPSQLEASSKWQAAVIELNELPTAFLPQEKLKSILNCISAIVDTAQFESDRRSNELFKLAAAPAVAILSSTPCSSASPPTAPIDQSTSSSLDSQQSSSPNPEKPTSIGDRSPSPSLSSPPITSDTPQSIDHQSNTNGNVQQTQADFGGPCSFQRTVSTAYSTSPNASLSNPSNVNSTSGNVSLVSIDARKTCDPNQLLAQQQSKLKPVDLAADDLLPILIFVLVQSKLSHLESSTQYLWQLSDPSDLAGEAGYYLTMLSSAIEYVKLHEEEPIVITSQPVNIISSTSVSSSHSRNVPIMDDDSDEENPTWLETSTANSPPPGSTVFPPASLNGSPNMGRYVPKVGRGLITIGSRKPFVSTTPQSNK